MVGETAPSERAISQRETAAEVLQLQQQYLMFIKRQYPTNNSLTAVGWEVHLGRGGDALQRHEVDCVKSGGLGGVRGGVQDQTRAGGGPGVGIGAAVVFLLVCSDPFSGRRRNPEFTS